MESKNKHLLINNEELLKRSKKRRESIKQQKLEHERIKREYGDDYIPVSEVKRKYSVDFWSTKKSSPWLVSVAG